MSSSGAEDLLGLILKCSEIKEKMKH